MLGAYLTRLVGNFGANFTLLMVSEYFLVKGVMHAMIVGSSLPYFKNYLGMGGDRYQAYGTVAGKLQNFSCYCMVLCGVGGFCIQVSHLPSVGSFPCAAPGRFP